MATSRRRTRSKSRRNSRHHRAPVAQVTPGGFAEAFSQAGGKRRRTRRTRRTNKSSKK
jgi:hypothetical protein